MGNMLNKLKAKDEEKYHQRREHNIMQKDHIETHCCDSFLGERVLPFVDEGVRR